jgi:hypothetical protein
MKHTKQLVLSIMLIAIGKSEKFKTLEDLAGVS